MAERTHIEEYSIKQQLNGCYCTLTWKEIENADGYMFMVKDKNRSYTVYDTTENNSYTFLMHDLNSRTNVKIVSYHNNGTEKCIISESTPWVINTHTVENMNVKACRSYQGITISWSASRRNDGFLVFKRKQDSCELICKTVECQANIKDAQIGDTYIIQSYILHNKEKFVNKISEEYTISEFDYKAPKEKKISVIVPCYNNELLIPRCIDSILLSTFKDFELILIDDGSTDNSSKIVDWYCENYPLTVTAVHTENQGVALARNEGITRANGEYIYFADNDDVVFSQMLEACYSAISKFNCDIVFTDYYVVKNSKKTLNDFPFDTDKLYDTEESVSKMLVSQGIKTMIWYKLYRSSFVKEHLFANLQYEDIAWTPYLNSYVKSFAYVNIPLYIWDRDIASIKDTLSIELFKMNRIEKSSELIKSVDFFLKNGDMRHEEALISVAVKWCIDCINMYINDVDIFYNKIKELHKKFNLLNNKYINKDAHFKNDVIKCLKKIGQ